MCPARFEAKGLRRPLVYTPCVSGGVPAERAEWRQRRFRILLSHRYRHPNSGPHQRPVVQDRGSRRSGASARRRAWSTRIMSSHPVPNGYSPCGIMRTCRRGRFSIWGFRVDPVPSPDASSVAYVKRPGTLLVESRQGTRRVNTVPKEIESFDWFPDGRHIV